MAESRASVRHYKETAVKSQNVQFRARPNNTVVDGSQMHE